MACIWQGASPLLFPLFISKSPPPKKTKAKYCIHGSKLQNGLPNTALCFLRNRQALGFKGLHWEKTTRAFLSLFFFFDPLNVVEVSLHCTLSCHRCRQSSRLARPRGRANPSLDVCYEARLELNWYWQPRTVPFQRSHLTRWLWPDTFY